MDPAYSDMPAASIGRSPRSDAGHPVSDQADISGQPLDHPTNPASMEAGLRQYKDINSPYPSGSSPLDPLVVRPIALQTAAQPAMNPDQPNGSEAAEPQRKAAPDVLPRDPADIPDTTCDSTVPASLPPPAEAPVEPRHPHDQGPYRAPRDHMQSHGAMPEAAPSSDPQPSTAPPNLSQGNIGAILESATRNTPAEAPMDLTLPLDLGYRRAPPDHAQGYGAMPEAAPSSDPQPATALPYSTPAALHALSESATLSRPFQTSSRAEISVEAKPPSVTFSDSGSDGSADAKATSRATAETRPTPAPPFFTPTGRSLPASAETAVHTLVPNPRPRATSTVTKLMHELKVAEGEREELKLKLAHLDQELQATEEERDVALFELGTVQDELSCVTREREALIATVEQLRADNGHLSKQLESTLALVSTDPVALALTSTDSVAPAPTPTDLVALPLSSTTPVAPRSGSDRSSRPRTEAGHPSRPYADADRSSRPYADADRSSRLHTDAVRPSRLSMVPTVAPGPVEPMLEASDSSGDSDSENELLPVDKKYMSSKVQDRVHVEAVAKATAVDPTGLSAFRRTLYTPENAKLREKNTKISPKDAMHAGKGVADDLEVPPDLDADDARARGLAYLRDFRGDLADMLSSALQKGAPWPDVLRSMASRFKHDHDQLYAFVKTAIREKLLPDQPLLHADVLLFKLDHAFHCKEHSISEWDQLQSRTTTMDAGTLLAAIVDAYLDKIDDPDVNRKNVLKNKNHRLALADKVATCLLNDETDEARGLAVFDEFNKTWGHAEREYSLNPSKSGLADLDLQRFGENKLKEAENRYERECVTTATVKSLRLNPAQRIDRTVAAAHGSHSETHSEADTDLASDRQLYPPPPRQHRPKGQGAQRRRDERHTQERYQY